MDVWWSLIRKNPITVTRRNVILILLAGFVLAFGAAGAAQRDQQRSDRPLPATSDSPQNAPGGLEANVVKGSLPADRVVRAVVGDDVELSVTSNAPDVAKIVELGIQTAVGPGLPGTLSFRALTAGRFPVTLDVAGTEAGAVKIAEERDAQAEPAPP